MAMTSDKTSSCAPLSRHLLWIDTRSGVNRLIGVLALLCLLLFAVEFVWHRHVKVPYEEMTGFYAVAGSVAFSVIVLGARLLRLVVRRDESFYAPVGVDAEAYPQAGTCRLTHEERPDDSLATLRDELLGRSATPADEACSGRTVAAPDSEPDAGSDHKGASS